MVGLLKRTRRGEERRGEERRGESKRGNSDCEIGVAKMAKLYRDLKLGGREAQPLEEKGLW
jgi:hypothetical protein